MIQNDFFIVIAVILFYVIIIIELIINSNIFNNTAQLKVTVKKALKTIKSNKISDREKEKILFLYSLNCFKFSFKFFLFFLMIFCLGLTFYFIVVSFLIKDKTIISFLFLDLYFELILLFFSIIYVVMRRKVYETNK